MAPSCWKEFIYVVCCFLGDDYLDEIYEYEEKEQLCPRQLSLQTNKQSMRKTQSCCLIQTSQKTTNKKKKKRQNKLDYWR
jgi:hypothetical protein